MEMRMNRKTFAVIMGVSILSAASAGAQSRMIAPACQKAFGADICVSGKMSGKNVTEIEAVIPMAAISNAPKEMEMKWPPPEDAIVSLPAELSAATGIQTLTFYWEPMGHPPAPFMTPHFDFHFNTISEADRRAMDCSDHVKPNELPSGYALTDDTVPNLGVLVGTCVPLMGMHALSMAGQPTPFSATMVLGYYHGSPIFFEPMISQATLMSKKPFSLPILAPIQASSSVVYPSQFNATYDAASNSYRFVLTGFKNSKPAP
jgi:hypothetical protein